MTEINIKSTTVEKGLELLKDMLSKIAGPAAGELGEIFSDHVKYFRLKNQLKIFGKVEKLVEKNNINIKQVNIKTLLPYLENASLEDDDSLQDLWANLLANYMDASKVLNEHVFPKILADLSTNDVTILEKMRVISGTTHATAYREGTSRNPKVIYRDEIGNLLRLGLIEGIPKLPTGVALGSAITQHHTIRLIPDAFRITSFGTQFLKACDPPTKQE